MRTLIGYVKLILADVLGMVYGVYVALFLLATIVATINGRQFDVTALAAALLFVPLILWVVGLQSQVSKLQELVKMHERATARLNMNDIRLKAAVINSYVLILGSTEKTLLSLPEEPGSSEIEEIYDLPVSQKEIAIIREGYRPDKINLGDIRPGDLVVVWGNERSHLPAPWNYYPTHSTGGAHIAHYHL